MPFKAIGLHDQLVQGILATGYKAPTEIQSQAIPVALAGRDLIGCAQTGTGKTAAFVLPLLNRFSKPRSGRSRNPRGLILAPTRELAVQIDQSVRDYGRFMKLRSLAVFGGAGIQGQIQTLKCGVDIVIATPGRLMDHMQRGTAKLHGIEVLVIDEADRMFDMGFIRDVRKIVAEIPVDRQTLLFSATFSREIRTLTGEIQKSPRLIEIGKPRNPVETITQYVYPVEKPQKLGLLIHLLNEEQMDSVLVFSRTKYGANRITRGLKKSGIRADAIHSDRTQAQRQRALDGFKLGKVQVMVATDIASRGIDVEGISHVINYDVPAFPEDYIHRIGRTGRAAKTGDAITFVTSEETDKIKKIERFIGRKIQTVRRSDFVYKEPVLGTKQQSKASASGNSTAKKKSRPRRRRRKTT